MTCSLLELSQTFDDLRKTKDVDYTEEEILNVLKEANIDQYKLIDDVPSRIVNELLNSITNGDCRRLDPNQEQEILDFFEKIQSKHQLSITAIAKGLRYLLRKDTTCKTVLLVVDVQNDFIDGSLALKNAPAGQDGEEVVEIINTILAKQQFDLVAYTYDWHPAEHCSFLTNVDKYPLHSSSPCSVEEASIYSTVVYDGEKALEQILWPDHCVQNSFGAELHENLDFLDGSLKVYKGEDCRSDSYSVFWNNGKLLQTDLLLRLLDQNITTVYICGLALDFCVGYSALDSSEHGFKTYVIEDACRGVNDDNINEMKKQMKNADVEIIQVEKLTTLLSAK